MSSKKIWLGHPDKHMQWVPAPLAGAESQNVNYVESIEFENGGGDVFRSKQYRKQYEFEFNAPLKGSEELNVFNKFASGYYGGGLIHFADPYAFETNLLSAPWATPGLIERGWKNIYTTTPTFSNQHGLTLRTNICTNPSFETNTTNWGGTLATLATTTAQAFSGTSSLSLTSTAAGTISAETAITSMPASPGLVYTLSGYVRSAAVSRNASITVTFYDSASVQVGVASISASIATTTTGWVRPTITATSPTGTAYVRAQISLPAVAGADEVHYVDAVLVEQSSTMNDYFDGSTPATTSVEYAWSGTAHASSSVQRSLFTAYDLPQRNATWSVTSAANAKPTGANHVFTVPIPPTHTLHLGATGTATGTATVMVEPVSNKGVAGTPFALSLLGATGSTRLNATVSGASFASARIYITRTSTDTSTITLNSIMAQLWKIGTAPPLAGDHIAGDGHTGLEFADDARAETYLFIDPPRRALSTTLVEVGAWR